MRVNARHIFLYIVIASSALVAARASHDFLLPLNVELTPPDATVPPTCARFFAEDGWGNGAWDDKRPHALLLLGIDFDCRVEVLYGYGGYDHDGTGEWLSLSGFIRGHSLVVPIDIYAADAEYEINAEATELSGRFRSRDGIRTARVTLTRL
ncbi:MAG: hypothetical protein CMO26_16010 [Thiotrichales bacterium]|nr:hypothetical protein [Thiotrichales bacterium]